MSRCESCGKSRKTQNVETRRGTQRTARLCELCASAVQQPSKKKQVKKSV